LTETASWVPSVPMRSFAGIDEEPTSSDMSLDTPIVART
jgi:hypothetical protein